MDAITLSDAALDFFLFAFSIRFDELPGYIYPFKFTETQLDKIIAHARSKNYLVAIGIDSDDEGLSAYVFDVESGLEMSDEELLAVIGTTRH